MFTNPTVSDFKSYFVRDFPYGVNPNTVLDSDITKALAEANFNFNPGLYSTQDQYTIAFLYLTAHYLVMDLRASSQGVAGSFNWMTTSKAVGSVSESFAIPDRIMNAPEFALFSKTYYGTKYLSLILPRMVGQIFSVHGRTKP